MSSSTTDWFVIIVFIPMVIAFIILGFNLFVLRFLFLFDKNIKKRDRLTFWALGIEIGYIADLPEKQKKKYLKMIKAIKYSAIVFALCGIALITEGIISVL
jgi:hypothetical protein